MNLLEAHRTYDTALVALRAWASMQSSELQTAITMFGHGMVSVSAQQTARWRALLELYDI